MADGIYAALSGAIAQQVALDTTANNAANSGTAGFHAGRPVFHEVLTRAGAKNAPHFASIASTALDLTPGDIKTTDRPLDVALAPNDFLAMSTARGERYTRSGALHLGNDGALKTVSGDSLVGEDNRPIKLDPSKPARITAEGEVQQDGATVARLKLVTFAKPEALSLEGSTVLASTPGAGAMTPSKSPLTVGALEGSNATPVQAMTDLINASRTFEAFQKTIEAFHDADRQAATQVQGEQ